MNFPMTPEMELKMWVNRVSTLEKAVEDSIKIIKVLRDSVEWTGSQRAEIDAKIEHLENQLIPF